MESVCLKMEDSLLKEIDSTLSNNGYSTRTEFIRDAIRDKLRELEKDEALKRLKKFFGASEKKTRDKKLEETRKKLSEEMIKLVK